MQPTVTKLLAIDSEQPKVVILCDTGTSGQRRSDGNIALVRFLGSHEGDGARAVFTGI